MVAGIYGADLARVHDEGFGDLAREAGDGIAAALAAAGIDGGRVVELGCGTGITTARLLAAGFEVLGIDLSAAALEIARERAPGARFERASAFEAELPECVGVTAVGEVLGYAVGERSPSAELRALFARVHAALAPGGLFLFDLAAPGREPTPRRAWREGRDWACLYEAAEVPGRPELRRRIVTFVRAGGAWSRAEEEHRLHLHAPAAVLADLADAGFEAEALEGYADAAPLPPGLVAYRATRI